MAQAHRLRARARTSTGCCGVGGRRLGLRVGRGDGARAGGASLLASEAAGASTGLACSLLAVAAAVAGAAAGAAVAAAAAGATVAAFAAVAALAELEGVGARGGSGATLGTLRRDRADLAVRGKLLVESSALPDTLKAMLARRESRCSMRSYTVMSCTPVGPRWGQVTDSSVSNRAGSRQHTHTHT